MGVSFFITLKNERFAGKRIECELSISFFIACFIEAFGFPTDIWRVNAAIYTE
jgi:hypothetical protein